MLFSNFMNNIYGRKATTFKEWLSLARAIVFNMWNLALVVVFAILATRTMIWGNGRIFVDINFYHEGWIEILLTYATALYMARGFKHKLQEICRARKAQRQSGRPLELTDRKAGVTPIVETTKTTAK